MPSKKFWDEGIRFECQGTGKCCMSRGEYGHVYLTAADRKRMAGALGLETRAFTQQYAQKTDGWFHLKNPEKTCQFLEGKQCKVYEGRPAQCRTWPFWPENMNPKTWNGEVVGFCKGIGKGRLYTKAEIEKQLAQDPLLEE